jgi:hypothetical protein
MSRSCSPNCAGIGAGWFGSIQSIVLGVAAMVMGVTGVALILWWVTDHGERPPTESASDRIELLPGPGLSPETVADFPSSGTDDRQCRDSARKRR